MCGREICSNAIGAVRPPPSVKYAEDTARPSQPARPHFMTTRQVAAERFPAWNQVSVPALCAIDQLPGNGGVSRVSTLLWHVMQDLSAQRCKRVLLNAAGAERLTARDKGRFAANVIAGQLTNAFDWLFFDHLGPATVQSVLPRRLRRPYGIFLHSIESWNDLNPIQRSTLKEATVRIACSQHPAPRILT